MRGEIKDKFWVSEIWLLQRTQIWFPQPHGGPQPSKLQFQGIQHPLLTSVGTRCTRGALAHMQAKHLYTTNKINYFFKMVIFYDYNHRKIFLLKELGSERGYSLTKPFFYWLKHSAVFAVILYKASALINSNLFEDRYFIMHLIQLNSHRDTPYTNSQLWFISLTFYLGFNPRSLGSLRPKPRNTKINAFNCYFCSLIKRKRGEILGHFFFSLFFF